MAEETQETTENHPEFTIQKIYTKDVSFEAPHSPDIFVKEWKPELHLNLDSKTNEMADNNHEVILTVTVDVKSDEKPAFLAEIQQAGIFTLKNFEKDQIKHVLGGICPGIIFPYAREAISDIVARGGFPQLYLAPINFEALYAKQQEEAGKAKNDSKEEE